MRPSRAACVIAISYVAGALAFILDLVFQSSSSVPIRVAIAGVYAVTAAVLSGGFWLHYRQRAPWRLLIGITAVHLVIYAALYAQGFLWLRSFSANIGCGFILMVGLTAFPRRGLMLPDKILFAVHAVSCIQCFTRPVLVALLTEGPISADNHSEDLFLLTLHLAVGAAAVTTGMLLLVILVRDIVQDLQSNSLTDELTNVYNRRGFDSRVQSWFDAKRKPEVGIILADLDRFKRINDTYGHAAGDDVITAFADVLNAYAGPGRVAARLGGEEFALALCDMPMSEMKGIAETLRATMAARTFACGGDTYNVTASFGVAQIHQDESLRNALARADDALYLAKREGRNRVCCQADLAVHNLTSSREALGPSSKTSKLTAKKVS